MSQQDHQYFMSRAISLAKQGVNTVSPNPMVGCVIVRDGIIVGEGYHESFGGAHAEINALNVAGEKAQGATAYVNLEPCCHQGKTPPCVNALIHANVKKILIATKDPNSLICGNGINQLSEGGIEVEVGIMEKEAQELNAAFFHYIKTKRPYVIAKWAMSLDGHTAVNGDDHRRISSEKSHQHAHDIRQQVDAILVGSDTIRKDNPQLTVRYSNDIKRHPIRIVLTSKGDIPLDANVMLETDKYPTIIIASSHIKCHQVKKLENAGAKVLIIESDEHGKLNLNQLLIELGKLQISALLIEGGNNTLRHFFSNNLINKVNVYIAPVIISDLKEKLRLTKLHTHQIEADLFFSAIPDNR